MFTARQHVDNLLRHIRLVQQNCELLAERMIDEGRMEFARILLANSQIHDASKWHGVEWLYLHQGTDVPRDKVDMAVCQHQKTNMHHPEYWGGLANMPEIYIAEMVCDWYARSQEFGKDLREWIKTVAAERFSFQLAPKQAEQIHTFVEMLLQDTFVR